MKHRWIIVLLTAAALTASLIAFDDPKILKECKDSLVQIEKDIQGIEKELDPLIKEIGTRGACINALTAVYDRIGKPIDRAEERLKKIVKDLANEMRRSGGLVGTGTLLNRLVKKYADGVSTRAIELDRQKKETEKEIENLTRQAEREIERALQHMKDPPLDIEMLRSELKAKKINQMSDEKKQNKLNTRLASRKDDLVRKSKECIELERRFQQLGGGGTGSPSGVVTFIGGIQIPTPKSGMDIPLVKEIEPVWPNYWEYFPLMQISPSDTRTKPYYDRIRKDFGDAIFGDEKSGNMPSIDSLFEKSATEFGKLLQISEDADWKGTPIQHYQGPYLVRVICASQTRYRFHYVSPDVKSTHGGIHLFGLAAGRHPVKVTIAGGNGQLYESRFEVFVHFEPEKPSQIEIIKDGKVTGRKTIIPNLAYLKKQFEEMWELHLRGDSQTQGKNSLRRYFFKSGVNRVHSDSDFMKKKPGCTAADIVPLLVKGAGAASLFLSEFGSDQTTNDPWSSLLTMARICKEAGTKEAYDVLAPLAQQAAGSAPTNRLNAVAITYTRLGDLALMHGNFEKAVNHLKTALDYRKRANTNFDLDKEKAGVPRVDQLKAMLALLGK